MSPQVIRKMEVFNGKKFGVLLQNKNFDSVNLKWLWEP